MSVAGLSVLTLVKNRPGHLARLIEGLVRSEVAPEELIVVDMGGDWAVPCNCAFPIRIIDMPSAGLPLAGARNAAAAAASSEKLLFLDVDCIPMRHLLASVDEEVSRTDGLVCREVRYLGAAPLGDDWQEESLIEVSQPHPARQFPEMGVRQESNHGLFWSLLFAIRRGTFMRLGGFDEEFSGYGAEDTDFGFRARAAAVGLYFSAGPGAFHQHHAAYDPPLQHFADIIANARVFYRKWQRWPMEGWLDRFESMGLVRRCDATLLVLRSPTAAEIADVRTENPF